MGNGRPPVTLICRNCSGEFVVRYKLRAQIFCSLVCRSKFIGTPERMSEIRVFRRRDFPGVPAPKICGICSAEFQPNSGRQKWCQVCVPNGVARARYQRYGIVDAQWREMTDRYGGKCWICRKLEAVCVDHDHDTGDVRGALCQKCNQTLGVVERAGWLTAALAYLAEEAVSHGRRPRSQSSSTAVPILDTSALREAVGA